MLNFDVRHSDISHHDRAGYVRHAADHDGEQLGFRHAGDEGPDGERRFGLAHEDAGGDVKRLRTTGAEHFLHGDGHGAHQHLHHAQIVHDGEERGDEDDDGQNLKGEKDAGARAKALQEFGEGPGAVAKRTEDKLTASDGVTEHGIDALPNALEDQAEIRFENDDREGQLQAQAPEQDARLDGTFVRGKQPGDREDSNDPEKAGESAH